MRASPEPWLHSNEQAFKQTPAMPLRVTVRVIYFSNDGEQADNGDVLELDVSTSTTVQALRDKPGRSRTRTRGNFCSV